MAQKAIQQHDNLILYDDTKYLVNEYGGAENFLEIVNITDLKAPSIVAKIFGNGIAHWHKPPPAAQIVKDAAGGFTIRLI